MIYASRLVVLTAMTCASVHAPAFCADDYAATSGAGASRYTFSWPLRDGALQPRGGSSKGPAVTLDLQPSDAWRALQAPGLSAFERDRRAILAMEGEYRVTFDFLEIMQFKPGAPPTAPYQSWGTEKIYVDHDAGKTISLVHMLEMRIVNEDGTVSEPMVTKHWRQDWRYEPADIVEHQGRDRWRRRMLPASEVKGAWSQTVHQVDESPRYASTGRWEHTQAYSTWLSAQTSRPLPRREWSVRDDYSALLGTNRHTVAATGWIQEENNLKSVLAGDAPASSPPPYLAREYGVARYERLRDADFAAADRYYERTKGFWTQVRTRWSEVFMKKGEVGLRGSVDKLGLFMPLFAHAASIDEMGDSANAKNIEVIERALRDMGAVD